MHYWLRLSDPTTHLIDIELRLPASQEPYRLALPVWTPGSYLVREYARHLQELSVADAHDQPVAWERLDKATWYIAANPEPIRVHYRLYGYELSVRTNHVDTSHAYITPAAACLYWQGHTSEPHYLSLVLPEGWQIATALKPTSTALTTLPTYCAQDYDELVDCPLELGHHSRHDFTVLDKAHSFVVWGEGNHDLGRIIADSRRIIETEAKIFGGLPYEHYLFILHTLSEGGGGLEHMNSTTLAYPRFDFRDPERYTRFLSLVAHEFFHLWNVKRLRPRALLPYDYSRESYFSSLWFCEGVTSYYDTLILRRAGLIDSATYLAQLAERITKLQQVPGRLVQSLADSSVETWIKLYRPHENSQNSQVSYYLKGEVVAALLDLEIRSRSGGQNSLDTVLQKLWYGYQDTGYSETELWQLCEAAATADLSDFYERNIAGTAELDYNASLNRVGLQLVPVAATTPYFGVRWSKGSNLSAVDMGSPAQQAGIWAQDEIVAINGIRVSAAQLDQRLQDFRPGDRVRVHVFQRDQLRECWVTLAEPPISSYRLETLPQVNAQQQALYRQWLAEA